MSRRFVMLITFVFAALLLGACAKLWPNDDGPTGYARIRTHTTNDRKPMLMLNLRAGFDIVGTTTVPGRPLKIVLERQLR